MEVFRRGPQETWQFTAYDKTDAIILTSLGLTLSMAAIYEDVVLGETGLA